MSNLKQLARNLNINEIDFRVGTVMGKEKIWATILAYKDARVDMNILDEVVGAENWQIKFREEKGSIVASIGIKCGDEWVWKENNGTPGDFEQEKGAYSDATKRAGFMWGIGRSLYNFPKIFVELLPDEHANGKATNKLRPNDWTWTVEYKDDKVLKVTAKDKNSKLRFNYELR